MPKPSDLPDGIPSDLFKEALGCLDSLTGQTLSSRLSMIGPAIFAVSKSELDFALWEAAECFYLDSIVKPQKRQKSLALKRFYGATERLRKLG